MREHNTDGRYFTLEEAQGLVPWLSEKFSAIAPLREQANKLNAEIESLLERMRSNGGSEASGLLERRRRTLQETADQIEQQVRLIQQPGLIVKGIERALVDFPSIREGREVYLCWLEGELQISFWHEVDAGFAGRQPL